MSQEIRMNITVEPSAAENVRLEWDNGGGEEIDAHMPRGTHDKAAPFKIYNDNAFPLNVGLVLDLMEGSEIPRSLEWHNREIPANSAESNTLTFSIPQETEVGEVIRIRIFPPWGPWPREGEE